MYLHVFHRRYFGRYKELFFFFLMGFEDSGHACLLSVLIWAVRIAIFRSCLLQRASFCDSEFGCF